ncbi:MAG: YeeE/YedE family protein [Defluviitaleaceae bacterium]|nr:YeeE/YedE family protein [Defluviitaleaceae bacterium]
MFYIVTTGILTGAALGFVFQRGKFCLTGGFRDMLISKDNRIFYALLLAILVQATGLLILNSLGITNATAGATFPWLALMLGSFMFGVGIILAGGCAGGTWQKAGQGNFNGWIALFSFALMATIMRIGPLRSFRESLQLPEHLRANNSIADTFGISNLILVILLSIIVLFFVIRELRKPKIKIATLKPKRTGFLHLLLEKRWHPFFTAIMIGIIGVIAWPISAFSGRNSGLGITTPTSQILEYLVLGESSLNWGNFLVIGILIGAFVCSKLTGEFRFRTVDAKGAINSTVGGFMMGFGATLGVGCTIGNGLVGTSLFSWQGWIGTLFIMLGVWVASYFVYILPRNKKVKMNVAISK